MSNLSQEAVVPEEPPVAEAEVAVAPGEPVNPADTLTVGKRLRMAREAANLNINDVAHALKFSARQIELLEADNYAALPGTTIVRGFARSYAKLLKLDADALLLMLNERTPNAPADVRPPENMGIAEDAVAQRQYSVMASAAIVIALAAALLGLWHYFGQGAKPATHTPGEPRAAAPVQAVPVAQDAVKSDAALKPEAAAGKVVPAPAPVDAGRPGLMFVFEGRSWLEVTDAARQVLHSGENLAGSQLSISGQPPFDIVVGNAGKVRLTYGEREIDLVPHTRAEVARFRLE